MSYDYNIRNLLIMICKLIKQVAIVDLMASLPTIAVGLTKMLQTDKQTE